MCLSVSLNKTFTSFLLPFDFSINILHFQDAYLPLQDGNGAIYPLAKDCIDGIRDPMWLDLPPVSCLSIKTHNLGNTGSGLKQYAAVMVLAIQVGGTPLGGAVMVLAIQVGGTPLGGAVMVLAIQVGGNTGGWHFVRWCWQYRWVALR